MYPPTSFYHARSRAMGGNETYKSHGINFKTKALTTIPRKKHSNASQRPLQILHRKRKAYPRPPKLTLHTLIEPSLTNSHTMHGKPVIEPLLILCSLRMFCQPGEQKDAMRGRDEVNAPLTQKLGKKAVRNCQALRVQLEQGRKLRPCE
jgi:hypothetical protein